MSAQKYRHFTSSTLLATEEVSSANALALASMPGACDANRFRVFVEMEETYAKGTYARIEFILPGKPGRWSAAGEVTYEVKSPTNGVPQGVCLELFGLALTAASVEPKAEPENSNRIAEDAEAKVGFDPSERHLDAKEVCGTLSALLGREVKPNGGSTLPGTMQDNALIAIYRNDKGEPISTIALDKAAATRIGGALSMLPETEMDDIAEEESVLDGEPLQNVHEVLNILSVLFHDATSPHVALAEVINGADMRDYNDGELLPLFDNPRWSLAQGMDIEDYGKAEVYFAAY